jgi:hypothetical protein
MVYTFGLATGIRTLNVKLIVVLVEAPSTGHVRIRSDSYSAVV